jgi:hypothetical protein
LVISYLQNTLYHNAKKLVGYEIKFCQKLLFYIFASLIQKDGGNRPYDVLAKLPQVAECQYLSPKERTDK